MVDKFLEGKRRLKPIALALFVSALLATLSLGGAFLLRSETIAEKHAETCLAIQINNEILSDLIYRAKALSLKAIREGKGNGTTVKEIKSFYGPTLNRLARVEDFCPPSEATPELKGLP